MITGKGSFGTVMRQKASKLKNPTVYANYCVQKEQLCDSMQNVAL